MRKAFQDHLKELEQDVFTMGEMVVMAVNRAVKALKERDLIEAEKIEADDRYINEKRWEIEEKSINLIATQQPVATDLREIIAILNIITDLERMGDYAEGLAKIVRRIGDQEHVKPLIDIPRMSEIAIVMIKKTLKAYLERNDESARLICLQDDEVDMLYYQVFRELITVMLEDPKTITRATYLIWAAHNIERIADRVTNICERIIFLVTGEMGEIKSENFPKS
jgi:phosphate transport system protein